jgi:hypothetical protein
LASGHFVSLSQLLLKRMARIYSIPPPFPFGAPAPVSHNILSLGEIR